LAWASLSSRALARKGSEPIYEDPFDLAAGGASLTRGTTDGMVFANPALLPLGGKFNRWLGSTVTVTANDGSVGLLCTQIHQNCGKLAGSQAPSTTPSGMQAGGGALADQLLKTAEAHPVQVGYATAVSWITSHFALGTFSQLALDARLRPISDDGLPELALALDSYNGVYLGTAVRTPWRWLTIGVAGKYVLADELAQSIKATELSSLQEKLKDMENATSSFAQPYLGLGADVGALLFFQGKTTDLSLALKLDDVGGTHFKSVSAGGAAAGGESSPLPDFPQSLSAGVGLTFHTGADAIHLAVDYRDIPARKKTGASGYQSAYAEPTFKKLHLGVKATIRTYVGLAAGILDGYPTAGVELDFLIFRLALASYTRELGDSPRADPRHIYMLSFSTGI